MGAPQKRGTSNSVATLPISTPPKGIPIFVIRRVKVIARVFSSLQRSLLNAHPAVGVRVAGVLMIRSSLGDLGVSLSAPAILQSVLTTTS